MQSREIVERTLDYRGPERVAAMLIPPFWQDILSCGMEQPGDGPWHDAGPEREERIDEWGNTWARLDRSSKGEVVRGALQSYDALDTLALPDLADAERFRRMTGVFAADTQDRYRVGYLPGFPFSLARKLRRLDRFLEDLVLERERVGVLLERLTALLEACLPRLRETGADGVMFAEDWGTQSGLMIHPQMWREVFAPGFERLCGAAHAAGLRVFMHSCGRITDIIPDLVAVGVDVLQFSQPRVHGLEALSRFHGQVTFWCSVDVQATLPTRDAARIANEARELLRLLGGPDGGLIAGCSPSDTVLGLEPCWQELACQTFTRYGHYRGSLPAIGLHTEDNLC